MGFNINNEFEDINYPKNTVMPIGVSTGIVARRCNKCSIVVFTSNNELKLCRKCNIKNI